MKNPFTPAFEDLPPVIAVFPLPNTVVMPGTLLPLNIFEPRYLRMVLDALGAERMIGMIQPDPSAEAREPEALCRTGTAGRITAFEETSDGRLLITLIGVCRFDIKNELPGSHGYRRFRVEWSRFSGDYADTELPPEDRSKLLEALSQYLRYMDLQVDWEAVETMTADMLVNFFVNHIPFRIQDRQGLIESVGLKERAGLLAALLEMCSSADSTPASSRPH